jgi:hypothetical protein
MYYSDSNEPMRKLCRNIFLSKQKVAFCRKVLIIASAKVMCSIQSSSDILQQKKKHWPSGMYNIPHGAKKGQAYIKGGKRDEKKI